MEIGERYAIHEYVGSECEGNATIRRVIHRDFCSRHWFQCDVEFDDKPGELHERKVMVGFKLS